MDAGWLSDLIAFRNVKERLQHIGLPNDCLVWLVEMDDLRDITEIFSLEELLHHQIEVFFSQVVNVAAEFGASQPKDNKRLQQIIGVYYLTGNRGVVRDPRQMPVVKLNGIQVSQILFFQFFELLFEAPQSKFVCCKLSFKRHSM